MMMMQPAGFEVRRRKPLGCLESIQTPLFFLGFLPFSDKGTRSELHCAVVASVAIWCSVVGVGYWSSWVTPGVCMFAASSMTGSMTWATFRWS